jgi:hypothetical protein
MASKKKKSSVAAIVIQQTDRSLTLGAQIFIDGERETPKNLSVKIFCSWLETVWKCEVSIYALKNNHYYN